jgi:hypothetical protein
MNSRSASGENSRAGSHHAAARAGLATSLPVVKAGERFRRLVGRARLSLESNPTAKLLHWRFPNSQPGLLMREGGAAAVAPPLFEGGGKGDADVGALRKGGGGLR